MNYNEILNIIGPCGLNCKKCVFNKNGDIKHHAEDLKKLFGSFDLYAERFVKLISPSFKKYNEFKEFLDYLTKVNCKGCRKQECSIYPNCEVFKCYKKKNVDFCFQCDEFPCENTNFDPDLKRRWILINERLKKIGIKDYCKESMKYSRYRSKVGPD